MTIDFESFGKIPRLFRNITVTEKIDGTNAAVGVTPFFFDNPVPGNATLATVPLDGGGADRYLVYAQSRNRIITPDKDNFGFARWVWDHAASLAADLGSGLHFGEWWGSGIQRGYGLANGDKRFSLFNVKRWDEYEIATGFTTPWLTTVPVIQRGEMSTVMVKGAIEMLRLNGSYAAPGFMNPEGVVVYHAAGNTLFKATIDNDETPKTATVTKLHTTTDAINEFHNRQKAA